jgi:hypothetical protein
MVFDPNSAKHADPPTQSDAAARRELEQAIAPTPAYYSGPVSKPALPVNVEGLAAQYEWVGLDPKEARKV